MYDLLVAFVETLVELLVAAFDTLEGAAWEFFFHSHPTPQKSVEGSAHGYGVGRF